MSIKKDKKRIDTNINSSINLFLFIGLPIATFISILSGPIWNLFYGNFDGDVLLHFHAKVTYYYDVKEEN